MISAPGVIVGPYRLLALIGRGGMAEVWSAEDPATGTRVAVKMLAGPARENDELRRRLLREARAASAIVHPSVVRIHGVFELPDGVPAIAMELLSGSTLRAELLAADALSLSHTAHRLVPVANALAAAHALGVVHRDLKPENVFVSPDGAVKVLDFGIAKLTAYEGAAAATAALTGEGAFLGTPGYMAPEQMFGEAADSRADAWALGVMLYECLSGGQPVVGRNAPEIMRRIRRDGITPLEALVPGLPGDVAWLSSRLLAFERDKRIADVSAAASILGKYAQLQIES
jgi:eukaryotic-like serine/threonine-protein kinase